MSATSQVTIYALLDPRTRACRYVGKSKHATVRGYQHLCASQLAPATHRNHWIKSLLFIGLKPEVVVLEETSSAEWQEDEMFWIAYLKGLGADLTNATAGGDGLHDPSPETREKIGASCRGKSKVFSAEHKRKIGEANRQRAKDPTWRANACETLKRARAVWCALSHEQRVRP